MRPLKTETFRKRFMAAVVDQGCAITQAEAVEYMEGNPVEVLHETPEQFAKGWIESYDDGS